MLGTLFATGARDSSVVLWSMNSLSAVKKFECAKDDFLESPTLSPSTSATSLTSGSASPISVIGIPVNQILVLCEVHIGLYLSVCVRACDGQCSIKMNIVDHDPSYDKLTTL